LSTTKQSGAESSDKPGELTGESRKSARRVVMMMVLFVVVPPVLTGVLEATTGWEFPPWFRDTLFILILCVEGTIMYWTGKMAVMMVAAENAYAEILALAEKVKTPLENIGKLLYGMSDLLPAIERIFASIPKEKARETLERMAKELERESMKPDQIADAAARLSGPSLVTGRGGNRFQGGVEYDVGTPRP
jgi:hypothetical protein